MKKSESTMQTSLVKILGLTLFLIAAIWGGYQAYASRVSRHRHNPAPMAWYLDLKTQDRFAALAGPRPAAVSPSGGEGVRAHVYACGKCPGNTEQWVAYLERLPEGATAAQQRTRAAMARADADKAAD